MSEQIALAWALVDGERVSASSMVGVDPEKRPAAVCPCCSEAVTWKAGTVVTPHVAHRPGSSCAVTNPETAAHWNAKYRLAERLNAGEPITFDVPCEDCGCLCRASINLAEVGVESRLQYLWSFRDDVWDLFFHAPNQVRAEVERAVGNRRVDVALVCCDRVIAAIEIKHSHAVDEQKRRDLAEQRVPWIEVPSSDVDATIIQCLQKGGTRLSASCDECFRRWFRRHEERVEAEERERERQKLWQQDYERRQAAARVDTSRAQWVPRPSWVGEEWEKRADNPPRLELVVSASRSVVRGEGPAAVAATLIAHNAATRVKVLEGNWRWIDAVWQAIGFAMDRLEQVAPGHKATIYTKLGGWREWRTAMYNPTNADVANRVLKAGHLLLHSKPGSPPHEAAFKRTHDRAYRALREGHATHGTKVQP
jgi:hypothetical protein